MNVRFASALLLAGTLLLPAGYLSAATAPTPERVVSMRVRILSKERYTQLRDEWKAYTEAHPRDPLGWAQLARVSSYAGVHCDEYVKHAEKAVALDRNNAEACATLGRYRWRTYCASQPESPAEAIRLLEHALELDPRLDDPRYILWTMYLSQGQTLKANAQLRALLDQGRMPEPLVDFGHNLLAGLEPRAILLTNGDNDTYPLIALQTARGLRTDVAVVNLSLLNLEWYRRQLREGPLAVPVPLLANSAKDIHSWGQSDEAVKGLLEALAKDGWERPLYVSVTVGNPQRAIPQDLMLEGLVYRVLRTKGGEFRVDVERTRRNFDQVYRLQSVTSLALDLNEWSAIGPLVLNYAAVMIRLAPALADAGQVEDARKRFEWMLDLAHFHKQDPARLEQWIDSWATRDPECPDIARWREAYLR